MKRACIAAIGLFLFSTAPIGAQSPESFNHALLPLDQVETVRFEALDASRLAEEDAFAEAMGQPPRFAIAHPMRLTPAEAGTWEHSVNGTGIWRYRVKAEGATSLNFGFTRYRLPEGATLYIGSADRTQVVGPFTAADNESHGQLWTPIIASDDVVIELNVPASQRNLVELELGSINQGYRGFGAGLTAGHERAGATIDGEGKACKSEGGRSGACNTDVMCLSEADPWNLPRRSVGAYSLSGTFACTGSLLNNTANDNRMLFATATHCGVTVGTASSIVVYWNYEWPTCRRPGAPGGTSVNPPDAGMTNSGGTFLAATGNPFGGCNGSTCSDWTLIELDDPANPAFNLYWAGWNREDVGAVCSNPADPASTENLCASIHHPNVDEKRITFVDQNMTTANIAGATGVHWLARWDQTPTQLPNFPAGGALPPSVTEPGSSGSPLYNAEQRMIGVLSGGASFCGAAPGQLTDQYGKLAHAWEGTGTPTTRVRDYLDPLNTNAITIGGIEGEPPGDADLSIALLAAPNPVDIGQTVTFEVDVANGGPDAASGVFVELALPDGLDYDTGSGTGWSCSETGGTVTCDLVGDLGNGASAATLNVIVDVNAEETGTVNIVASVDALTNDANLADNEADVDLEITGEPPLPDCIFADGFEVGGDGSCTIPNPDVIVVGPLDVAIPDDFGGLSVNWLTGDMQPGEISGYHFNPYRSNTVGATFLSFWWGLGDGSAAGVSDGANYLVLQSGDAIGPGSVFITTPQAAPTINWRQPGGVDGYLGFRFTNSDTGEINYGYMHLSTSGTEGFPATILGYAYNNAGDPITIP